MINQLALSESYPACFKCEEKSISASKCASCTNYFCLAHRNALDHACPSIPGGSATQHANASANGRQRPKAVTRKYNPKLELTRLKLHAKPPPGVPPDSIFKNARIHVRLSVPPRAAARLDHALAEKDMQVHMVYLSLDWTIGKSIDVCARAYGLENVNNDLTAGEKVSISRPCF